MVVFSPIFRVMREAEANKLKLTPQFLELKFIEAIADNTKIFFGDKVMLCSLRLYGYFYSCVFVLPLLSSFALQVPNMVLDQRLLGNFLKVSREVPKDVSKEMTKEANADNGETGNPEVEYA